MSHSVEKDAGRATVPFEAFDAEHPDHDWWFDQTGRCLAGCPQHVLPPGVDQ